MRSTLKILLVLMITVISGGLKAQQSKMTAEEKEEARARYEAYQEKLK